MFAAGELAMPPRSGPLEHKPDQRSLLNPESYEEMFREVKLKDGTDTDYGLGIQVRRSNGHSAIYHSGEISGFVSMNVIFPADTPP